MVAIASAHILQAENNGIGSIDALNDGFHLAFIGAAIVAAVAADVAFVAVKKSSGSSQKESSNGSGLEYFQDKKRGGSVIEPSFYILRRSCGMPARISCNDLRYVFHIPQRKHRKCRRTICKTALQTGCPLTLAMLKSSRRRRIPCLSGRRLPSS